MPKPTKPATTKGYKSFANFYLLKNRPATKYQLIIRLTVNKPNHQKLVTSILYNNNTIRLTESEFEPLTNEIVGGYELFELRILNNYLNNLAVQAVTIGDELFKQNKKISHTEFRGLLYKNDVSSSPLQIEFDKKLELISYSSTAFLQYANYIAEKENKKVEDLDEKKLVDSFLIDSKKIDKSEFTTEQIYQNGLWDRENIFEMFGSIYFDKDVPATYHKIVVRLLEYREHVRPSENIKDLNAEWLIKFFQFLNSVGWHPINTVNLDPLKYDRTRFFKDIKREPYKPKSLNKLIGIVKTLLVGNKSEFSFYKKQYINKLDLSDLRLAKITKLKDKDGTRIEHNLTKKEVDKLYWFKFDNKKIVKYQEIFNAVNKSKNIRITIDDLDTARKLFLLQVFFGGLRGYTELSTAKVLKHSGTEYKVTFYQNKVTQSVTNPLNAYTDGILKPLKYKIPELRRENARNSNESKSTDLKEQHYRSLLQTIASIVNFDREVLIDDVNFIHKPIKEIFAPYFSRKTFGTICSVELGLPDQDIELFTGHKGEKTELSSSYIQKNTIEHKKKLLKRLKIGKP